MHRKHGPESARNEPAGAASPYLGILERDSLDDSGVVPSPGYAYHSPDLICVQQNTYSNPSAQFGTTASYASDPNLPLISGQNNNFYVRGMNLGPNSQGGEMYLYWAKASLLLVPGQWFNQPLYALQGKQPKSSVTLPAVGTKQVTVGAIPFNWTPPAISGDHFCLVGALNVPPYNWPPAQSPTFQTMDQFLLWVQSNQNICQRNLTLITNPNQPQWDRLDSFCNPWTGDVAMVVQARCANVPVNTTIQLLSSAVGINKTQQISDPNQTVFSQGAVCPAGFNGTVETMATLPGGMAAWPTGARITTTVYVATSSDSPIAHLANHFGGEAHHPSILETQRLFGTLTGGNGQGVLVAAGNTSTAYQATT